MDKIQQLEENLILAQEKYRYLGMRNTAGLDWEERRELDKDYLRAESEVIQTQKALRAARGE